MAQTALASATMNATKSFQQNGATLDTNTQSGIANRQSLEQALQAIENVSNAVVTQTASQEQGNKALEDGKQALKNQLAALGDLTPEVAAYIDQVKSIPPTRVETDVQLNIQHALTSIRDVRSAMSDLNGSVSGSGRMGTYSTGGPRVSRRRRWHPPRLPGRWGGYGPVPAAGHGHGPGDADPRARWSSGASRRTTTLSSSARTTTTPSVLSPRCERVRVRSRAALPCHGCAADRPERARRSARHPHAARSSRHARFRRDLLGGTMGNGYTPGYLGDEDRWRVLFQSIERRLSELERPTATQIYGTTGHADALQGALWCRWG